MQKIAEIEHENRDVLQKAEESFEKAQQFFESVGNTGRVYLEVKADLAAARQTIGVKDNDIEKLKYSVQLFQEVEESARTNTHSVDDAGRLLNLANAQKDLAVALAKQATFADTASRVASESSTNLREAELIYVREGDQDHLNEVAKIRATIDKILS